MSSPADPHEVRIGTTEREESAGLLGEHFGSGRLTPDEYETRIVTCYDAKTRADLRPLFQDLPEPWPVVLRPPPVVQPLPFAPPPPYGVPPVVMYAGYPAPVGYSPKSRVVAGVLQIVLPFGAGRLYTGQVGMAILQFFVVLITFGFGALWPVIDGIVLLANGGNDVYGRRLHD